MPGERKTKTVEPPLSASKRAVCGERIIASSTFVQAQVVLKRRTARASSSTGAFSR